MMILITVVEDKGEEEVRRMRKTVVVTSKSALSFVFTFPFEPDDFVTLSTFWGCNYYKCDIFLEEMLVDKKVQIFCHENRFLFNSAGFFRCSYI